MDSTILVTRWAAIQNEKEKHPDKYMASGHEYLDEFTDVLEYGIYMIKKREQAIAEAKPIPKPPTQQPVRPIKPRKTVKVTPAIPKPKKAVKKPSAGKKKAAKKGVKK